MTDEVVGDEVLGAANEAEPPLKPERPTPMAQLRDWITIGTQSFGGGPSTLYLMRSLLVGRRSWLSSSEFVQDWTLSRLSIGNHLTALAALIGHRIGGQRGVVLAVAGLLIPSGIITAILTGGFGLIRDQAAVQSALAGVAPMTIGMMLGISTFMIRTIVRPQATRSWRLLVDIGVFGIAVALGLFVSGSTLLVIVGGAVIGWLFLGRDDVPPESIDG